MPRPEIEPSDLLITSPTANQLSYFVPTNYISHSNLKPGLSSFIHIRISYQTFLFKLFLSVVTPYLFSSKIHGVLCKNEYAFVCIYEFGFADNKCH